MKKFINKVDGYLSDSISGFCAAHEDIVTPGAGLKFVRRKQLMWGRIFMMQKQSASGIMSIFHCWLFCCGRRLIGPCGLWFQRGICSAWRCWRVR